MDESVPPTRHPSRGEIVTRIGGWLVGEEEEEMERKGG